MISIRNLYKSYGTFPVLENVSAEIEQGEVISIIGASGCGKSTFIRCVNRLEEPTSGEIVIHGENILDSKTDICKIRRKMGMVFQNFNLYAHLMVVENVMFGLTHLLKMSKQEAYDAAMKYLTMVGLQRKAMSYPNELSGGQKQRVAIARTLAMDPEIILLDEPTSALDPTMVGEVLSVIRMLVEQGRTMMIVTHEMQFAKDASSRIFYMDEKGIYEQGTPQQIFLNPQRPKTQAFIYQIKSFYATIQDRSFDWFELSSNLQSFLQKQLFALPNIRKVQLVLEEMLCQVLPENEISVTVSYSEITKVITFQFKYKGNLFKPFEEDRDNFSDAIVKNIVTEIQHIYKDGVNTLTLTIQF